MTQRTIKFRIATYSKIDSLLIELSEPLMLELVGNYITKREQKDKDCIEYYIYSEFTGLHDKNGTDIYENDIVHIKHPHRNREWTGQVIYEDYGFTGDGFYFSHFDYPTELFSEGTEYIEVIGNIYQNPELLEQEKI